VGKSTVTLGLARALLADGARVAILDCDLNGPTQAQMTGVTGRPWVPGELGLELPRSSEGLGVISLGSVLEADAALRFDAVSRGDNGLARQPRTVLGQLPAGSLGSRRAALRPAAGAERTLQLAQLGPRAAIVLVAPWRWRGRWWRARSTLAGRPGAPAACRVVSHVENMAGSGAVNAAPCGRSLGRGAAAAAAVGIDPRPRAGGRLVIVAHRPLMTPCAAAQAAATAPRCLEATPRSALLHRSAAD
jgi:hypothetical protein